jgi:adenine-specific DNA-methyltransferase
LIAPFAQQQRQLAEAWRKDATVHSTDYAMTIDRVPKKFHAEICRCAAQVATWRELFAIDADEAVQPAFLAEHPHLVLDTRYFDASFRRRLLRTLDKVDEQVDGILIHGENAAALRWLRSQPLSEVKCVFTDPPYNTGSGVWTYADRFEHAAWQTMMRDRLAAARELMAPGAAMFVVLDDHEQARLRLLLDELFGEENFLATIVWEKVHTRKNSARHFSVSHDYIVAFARDKRRWRRQLLPRDDTSAYANPDADPRGPWKVDPVYANKPYAAEYAIEKPNGVALAPPTGRYWRFSEATFAGKAAAGEVVWGNGSAYPMVKRYLADVQDGLVPTTLFSRTLAGDNASAAAELRAMFGGAPRVSYPKPSLLARRIVQIATEPNGRDVVLDFFAGSGSTVQGVIDQNRTDGGNRRWVAVEHGDCFDTLLVPRVMKSICASRWKQGKPASNDGVSQVVKIVRLEAFEESLARQID